MGLSQLSGTSYTRLATKQNTVGQTSLAGTGTVVAGTSASGNIYGSWAQATASTGAELYIVAVTARCETSSSSISGPTFVDIGIGGAGSETVVSTAVIVGAEMQFNGVNPANCFEGGTVNLPIPVRVAAGIRVAVRTALAQTGGSGRSIDMWLLTVPYANVEGN